MPTASGPLCGGAGEFPAGISLGDQDLKTKLAAGACLLQLNEGKAAVEIFDRALAQAPESEEALFGKAAGLQLLWEFDEATTLYERILAANPHSDDSLANLISLSLQSKDYSAVCKWSEQLLAAVPTPWQLWSAWPVHRSRTEISRARKYTSRLTELAPNSYDHWFNLGVALQRLGRLSASANAYQRASKIRPEATFAHINLGVVYRELGDLANSRAAFERAVQAAPERADLKLELASVIESAGLLEEAESLYAALVETNPELENAWFRLGYLRLQRGDYAAAFRRSKRAPESSRLA